MDYSGELNSFGFLTMLTWFFPVFEYCVKASEEEHDIIRFINSYNNQVVKDGYKEMRYTADDVYDIRRHKIIPDYFHKGMRRF